MKIKLLLLGTALFLGLFIITNNQKTYAITCPDGSTRPDSQADQCPPASDQNTATPQNNPGSTGLNCIENADSCDAIIVSEDANNSNGTDGKQCGKAGEGGSGEVVLSINIGCRGENWPGPSVNPIVDMAFALFRVLSAGVGLVVIGSMIVAGIQYSASRGNPQSTQAAINRVTSAFIALLMYILLFAIAQFLIPGGMLR